MKIIINLLLVLLIFVGCGHKKTKIHEYKTEVGESDWIWWYVIDADDGGCYVYKSATPVTNFSSVQFSKSASKPSELDEEEETEVESEVSEDVSNEASETTSESSEGDGGGDSGGDSGGGDGGGGDGGGD